LGKKDDRTDQEKKDWEAGKMRSEELERQRTEGEREAGNPLAPPE
jgi:hypothetical protein